MQLENMVPESVNWSEEENATRKVGGNYWTLAEEFKDLSDVTWNSRGVSTDVYF